jgi:Xaa-Pro aminopeptidase
MDRLRLEAVLFSDPESICYLTSYANATDTSFPFKGCPLLTFVVHDYEPVVVLPCTEEGDFRQSSWVRTVFTYSNYDLQRALDIAKAALETVVAVMKRNGFASGRIGYEALHLPACLYEGLREHFGRIHWIDVTNGLAKLRAVKTPDEIESIRRAAYLCDVGQARVRELTAPGTTEIAIFTDARACMERAAGQRIHVAGDLVTGERSGAGGGGLPRADRLERGDLVISDIVPRLNGWWGDSCATLAVGEPSGEHRRIHRVVADAFQIGLDVAKPGLKSSELDARVRGYVKEHGYRYDHHTGHGVGVAQTEAPWIVPYNDEVLEENMVITLEPGAYPGGRGGVRIEDLFLVTRDGLEALTHHDKRLCAG